MNSTIQLIGVYPNGYDIHGTIISFHEEETLDIFIQRASRKLWASDNGKRIFDGFGKVITKVKELLELKFVFLSQGEEFRTLSWGKFQEEALEKKRHACPFPECMKTFGRKNDLDIHLRKHNKEKPYICPVPLCGKRFVRISTLHVHERNIHSLFLTGKKPEKVPSETNDEGEKKKSSVSKKMSNQKTKNGSKKRKSLSSTGSSNLTDLSLPISSESTFPSPPTSMASNESTSVCLCTNHSELLPTHKTGCPHTRIIHDGHVDFLYDSLLFPFTDVENSDCHGVDTTIYSAFTSFSLNHSPTHVHGENCGHPTILHGDHYDYLVNGQLHHYHNNHCEDHGSITFETTNCADCLNCRSSSLPKIPPNLNNSNTDIF